MIREGEICCYYDDPVSLFSSTA